VGALDSGEGDSEIAEIEMSRRRIHLEKLEGRRVVDSAGKKVGRIEEVHAERVGEECLIEEYVLGEEGLMERLSVLKIFFSSKKKKGKHVPWKQMDLSDPRHPKLRCTSEELDRMQPEDRST
jgi:sporulation protein YlmC with PRC-barrel domain